MTNIRHVSVHLKVSRMKFANKVEVGEGIKGAVLLPDGENW